MSDIRIRAREIRNPSELSERLNAVLGDIDRRLGGVEDLPIALQRFDEDLERFRAAVPNADAFDRSLAALEEIRAVVVARAAELVGAVERAEEAANLVDGAVASKQDRGERGQPNGYAPLDEAGRLALALLPALGIENIQTLAAALADLQPRSPELTAIAALVTQGYGRGLLQLSNSGAIRSYIGALAATTRGAANGVAPLGADGKLPEGVLPSLAVIDTTPVASQAEMLALDAQKGDMAVRTDLKKTFILGPGSAAVLANWIELQTPADAVLTVAGKVGNIILQIADIVSLQSALDNLQPKNAGLTAIAGLSTTSYGRQTLIRADAADLRNYAGAAAVTSPAFSGTPTAPTPAAGTNTTQLATTAFVQAAVAALAGAAPTTLDTLVEIATALGNDPNFATTILNALANKQPLDSDLTAIAALTTTTFGRSVLERADAAALRTLAGLSPAAVQTHETGSWTPTVGFATTNGFSPTYVEQVGRYLKFGSWILIMGRVQFHTNDYSASPPAGGFQIAGLPYSVKNLYPVACRINKASQPANHLDTNAITGGGGAFINFRSFVSAMATDVLWTASQLPASTNDFIFSFTLISEV